MELNITGPLSDLAVGMADHDNLVFEEVKKPIPKSRNMFGNEHLPKSFTTRKGNLVLYNKPDYRVPTHMACQQVFGNVRQMLNGILHFTPPAEQKLLEKDYYSLPGRYYASYAGFAKCNLFFPKNRKSDGKEFFPKEIIEMGVSLSEYLRGQYENSVISQQIPAQSHDNQNANPFSHLTTDNNANYYNKNAKLRKTRLTPLPECAFWSQQMSIIKDDVLHLSPPPRVSRNSPVSIKRPKIGRRRLSRLDSIDSISLQDVGIVNRNQLHSASQSISSIDCVDSDLLIEEDLPVVSGGDSSNDSTNNLTSTSMADPTLFNSNDEADRDRIIANWFNAISSDTKHTSSQTFGEKKESNDSLHSNQPATEPNCISEKVPTPFIQTNVSPASTENNFPTKVRSPKTRNTSRSSIRPEDCSRVTDTYAIKDQTLPDYDGDSLSLSSGNTFHTLANMRLSNIQVSQPLEMRKSCLKSSSDTTSKNDSLDKKKVCLKLPKLPQDTSATLANFTLATEDISLMDSSSMSEEQTIIYNFPDRNQNNITGNSGSSSSLSDVVRHEQLVQSAMNYYCDEKSSQSSNSPEICKLENLDKIRTTEKSPTILPPIVKGRSSKCSIDDEDTKSSRSCSLSSMSNNSKGRKSIDKWYDMEKFAPTDVMLSSKNFSTTLKSAVNTTKSKAKKSKNSKSTYKKKSKKDKVKCKSLGDQNVEDNNVTVNLNENSSEVYQNEDDEVKKDYSKEIEKLEADIMLGNLKGEKFKKGEEKKLELELELMKLKTEEEFAKEFQADIQQQIMLLEGIVKNKWIDTREVQFEDKKISMIKRMEEYMRRRSLKSNEERARLERENDTNALLDFEDKEKQYEELMENRLEKQIEDSRLNFLEMNEEDQAEWDRNEAEARDEATATINQYLIDLRSKIQAIEEDLYQHSALSDKVNPVALWEEQRRNRPMANLFTHEEGLLYYYKMKSRIVSIYERKFKLCKGAISEIMPKGPFNSKLIDLFKKLSSKRKHFYLQQTSSGNNRYSLQKTSVLNRSNNSNIQCHNVSNNINYCPGLRGLPKNDKVCLLKKEAAYLSHKSRLSKPWVFSYGVAWPRIPSRK